MDNLIIPLVMGIGALIFVLGALKMFSGLLGYIKAIGGLEGLKAQQLRLMEEQPAAVVSVVTPVGSVQATRRAWLFFAFAALVCFGLGGFLQYRAIRSARLLESEGISARATVTDTRISEDDDGDETYYVAYRFDAPSSDAGSQQVQREESVPYVVFAQAEEGGSIDIIYARSDPKVAQILANYMPGEVSYVSILVGGIMGVICALLAIPLHRRFQDAIRLDAEGVLTTTTVLDLFAASDSDSTTHYVAYTLPDGQKVRHGIKPAIYKQLHVGDALRLVYLPDNPKVFRLELD